MKQIIFNACLLLITSVSAKGQDIVKSKFDTAYYEEYPRDLVTRVYVSRKYNFFEVKQKSAGNRLQYRPNTTVNLGVGVTYRKISLNLAAGFGFLNPDQGKGKTKKLDLQSRVYGRKWLIDLSGEFFDGYYLYPKGKEALTTNSYYTRPDLAVNVVGISAYRLFNSRKLSFRHGFVRDEFQKKSAGSFLAGGSFNYASVKADSSVIPLRVTRDFGNSSLLSLKSFVGSGGIGYAHTLILPAHFYISGALIGQLNLGYSSETSLLAKNNKLSLTPTLSHKISAGYYNGTWNLSAFWVNNRFSVKGFSDNSYLMNTGVVRIIASRRFTPSLRLKQRMKPLDRLLDLVSKN